MQFKRDMIYAALWSNCPNENAKCLWVTSPDAWGPSSFSEGSVAEVGTRPTDELLCKYERGLITLDNEYLKDRAVIANIS